MAHDLSFQDVLRAKGIDPSKTLVMRHQPHEPLLRKQFPWIVMNRPDLFDAYQKTQLPRQEKQLLSAKYLASFVGGQSQRAIFVGLYKNCGSRPLSHSQYWKDKARLELSDLGMKGFDGQRASIKALNWKLWSSLPIGKDA